MVGCGSGRMARSTLHAKAVGKDHPSVSPSVLTGLGGTVTFGSDKLFSALNTAGVLPTCSAPTQPRTLRPSTMLTERRSAADPTPFTAHLDNATERSRYGKLGRIAIAVSLSTSIIAYRPEELSVSILTTSLLPIILVGLYSWLRNAVRGSFFGSIRGGEVVRLVVVPIIPLIVSAMKGDIYGVQYGLMIVTTVLCCRLFWDLASIDDILSGAADGALLWICALLYIGAAEIRVAMSLGTRLDIPGLHPNSIGMTLACMTPVLLWATRTGHLIRRAISAMALAVSLTLIVLASSRGSLLATLIGLAAYIGLSAQRSNKTRPLHTKIVLAVGSALVLALVAGLGTGIIGTVRDQAGALFAVDDPFRGMNTGFSGRLEVWRVVITMLQHDAWLTGTGYRAGSKLVGIEIDNGFLTVWLEMGLLGIVAILARYVFLAVSSARRYLASEPAAAPAALCVCIFMIVFLTNNVFARYLFGMGNPASLFALVLYAGQGRIFGPLPRRVSIRERTVSERRQGILVTTSSPGRP
jgi:exopolysaccharide production protein ExoQ